MANPKDIDMKILEYIVKQDWPVTTEMVGKEFKVSWNTAQLHLYKLLSDRMIKGKRIGRQNQWVATEKGKKTLR